MHWLLITPDQSALVVVRLIRSGSGSLAGSSDPIDFIGEKWPLIRMIRQSIRPMVGSSIRLNI